MHTLKDIRSLSELAWIYHCFFRNGGIVTYQKNSKVWPTEEDELLLRWLKLDFLDWPKIDAYAVEVQIWTLRAKSIEFDDAGKVKSYASVHSREDIPASYLSIAALAEDYAEPIDAALSQISDAELSSALSYFRDNHSPHRPIQPVETELSLPRYDSLGDTFLEIEHLKLISDPLTGEISILDGHGDEIFSGTIDALACANEDAEFVDDIAKRVRYLRPKKD